MAIGRATQYLRDALMDHSNGVATYTAPATVILGFTTVAIPTSANTYAAISATECTGNGYAQTTITNSGTTWAAADASGASTNVPLITCFTASGNWTVQAVSFFVKHPSNGFLMWTGNLDVATPMLPVTGQIVTFPPGSIILTNTFSS